MDPITAAIILTMITGAASTYNQYQAAKYQQKVAENNQKQADIQAKDALARGALDEQAQRRKNAAAIGDQRAALAAAGIEGGTGGALDLLGDTAFVNELDAQIIRENARREAYGIKVAGAGFGAEAAAYGQSAKMAVPIGILSTGASVLSMATMYQKSPSSAPSPQSHSMSLGH